MTDYAYFEDFVVGQTRESAEITVSEAEIIEFAQKYDPQAMHTDPQAAKTITGGLIASGWHTASLTMRLMVAGTDYKAAPGTVGLGFESLKWPRPVRPGDTLRLHLEVIGTRASASKPDWGIISNRFTTLNQNGEPVQIMESSAIFPRRKISG